MIPSFPSQGGRKGEGVGVMKGKGLKLEEIEASHKLGGVGKGGVQGRGKWRGFTYYSDVTIPRWLWRNSHESWGLVV